VSIENRKFLANLLIALCAMGLLSANRQTPPSGDWAYVTGELVAFLLFALAFVLSVRWRVKLAGYQKTCGRQAVGIFLVVFCIWSLLIAAVLAFRFVVAMITNSPGHGLNLIPLVLFCGYILGLAFLLRASFRWLDRLQLVEKSPTSGSGQV
jgi:hypothetical protein